MKFPFRKVIVPAVLLFAVGSPFFLFQKQSYVTVVTKVIDGDTVEIVGGMRVRLIGVDTPELRNMERNLKNAGRQGLDPQVYDSYAEVSKKFVQDLVLHQTVRLEYDEANKGNRHKDKYGRLLAYLWLESPFLTKAPDWAVLSSEAPEEPYLFSLNASLVKSGHALAYVGFPFKYRVPYQHYELDARENKRGYWKSLEKPISEKILVNS